MLTIGIKYTTMLGCLKQWRGRSSMFSRPKSRLYQLIEAILKVPELLTNIFLFIDIRQLAKISTTSKLFYSIISSEDFIQKSNQIEKWKKYSQNSMQLFFKGFSGQTDTFEISPMSPVQDIKNRYAMTMRCKKDCIRFIYAGRQLEDKKTLDDYSITKEATIHVVGKIRGD